MKRLWALVALGLVSMSGCGARAGADVKSADAAAAPGADGSRCAFRGRTDRIAVEAAAAGSSTPNVRRVYAIVKEGEESRRILVCREADTNFDGKKDVVRSYDEKNGPLKEAADTNYDGRLDTWVTFRKGHVAEVLVDKNGDGKPDESRRYVDGHLVRLQRDASGDGRTDQWEVYKKGALLRLGVDTDADGRVDRWYRDSDQENKPEEP